MWIKIKKFQPVIKWSGSKRSQCEEIINRFPKSIETYYEPFCGGCSMLRALIESGISVKRYVCSDLNQDLISLWNTIKSDPQGVFDAYTEFWNIMNCDDDIARRRSFYERTRAEFNLDRNPYMFFCIMRTCTNGMPRYNRNGMFNNSFHITRGGITPENLKPILFEWSELLNEHNVEFRCCSYEDIILNEAKPGDFVYMDPPYANTKGMYFGAINLETLFSVMKTLCDRVIKFAMSFDGKSGDCDHTYDVPGDCYAYSTLIESGNSSFKRTTGKDKHAKVYESLYINDIVI